MKAYEPDGGGFEGPTYWDYGSRYNVFFLDALENSLGTDFGLGSFEGFRRSGIFKYSYLQLISCVLILVIVMLKQCQLPNIFGWEKDMTKLDILVSDDTLKRGVESNILDLLWFDNRFKNFDLNSMPLDKYFRVAEIVTMRDSWDNGKGFSVALKGGSSTRVHSHMDLGSFILEYDGVRWVTDFGKDAQTYQRHTNKAIGGIFTEPALRGTTL